MTVMSLPHPATPADPLLRQALAATPAPALDTGPLAQDEAMLSHRERELEAREAAVGYAEVNALADQTGIEGRCRAIERRSALLVAAGLPGARELRETLPRPAPPPSLADRRRALNMRRAAIDARESAARRREEAVALLLDHLARSRVGLADAEEVLAELVRQAEADAERGLFGGAHARSPAAVAGGPAPTQDAAVAPPGADGAPPRDGRLARVPTLPGVAPPPGLSEALAADPMAVTDPWLRARPAPAAPAGTPAPDPVKAEPTAPPADADERRGTPRLRMDCRVGLESHDNFYTGFARDLSDGGLFVATFDILPVGTSVDVSFSLPDGTQVDVRARVRWVRDLAQATTDAWPGMGLCFESVPPGAAAAIERFMLAREPIFYVD